MKLAIFDLDHTLLAGDSDYEWGNFLVSEGVVDTQYYQQKNDEFYQQYQDKTLDIIEYQEFVLAPLTQLSSDQRNSLHHRFMATVIAPLRQQRADDLIAKHQKNGDTLLVITATNHFIASPIVRAMGIHNVLATDPEIVDGQFTGKVMGTPCFQKGKIMRLQSWLTQQEKDHQKTFNHMTFYSDSINDAPLLGYVNRAIAVDPDDKLRRLAEEKNWDIISLRE
ncbi:MAG: HAD superfamily hydrolase (TIGR01490 family) [Candidatus Endobugula sp.]|jgi:HAD superfamily hydrolase (TIGR01490 family)